MEFDLCGTFRKVKLLQQRGHLGVDKLLDRYGSWLLMFGSLWLVLGRGHLPFFAFLIAASSIIHFIFGQFGFCLRKSL